MAQSGDIFQLVLQGTNQGETWVNAFYYRLMDPPSEAHMQGLNSEFQTQVMDKLVAFAPPTITFDQINIRNLWTGDELVAVPSPRAGARTVPGEMSASFIAGHIKLVRSNNRVRHGHKYVTGVYEGDIAGQTFTVGAMGYLQAIANAFRAELNPGLVDKFKPVIIGRVLAPKKNGPGDAYRLPETPTEMGEEWAYITDAVPSVNVTTMRSRKVGHGI